MAKVGIKINYDYIMGHIRYGHDEGELEIPDDELDAFLKNPKSYIEENDLLHSSELNLVIDDYYIDQLGDIKNVEVYPLGGGDDYD